MYICRLTRCGSGNFEGRDTSNVTHFRLNNNACFLIKGAIKNNNNSGLKCLRGISIFFLKVIYASVYIDIYFFRFITDNDLRVFSRKYIQLEQSAALFVTHSFKFKIF